MRRVIDSNALRAERKASMRELLVSSCRLTASTMEVRVSSSSTSTPMETRSSTSVKPGILRMRRSVGTFADDGECGFIVVWGVEKVGGIEASGVESHPDLGSHHGVMGAVCHGGRVFEEGLDIVNRGAGADGGGLACQRDFSALVIESADVEITSREVGLIHEFFELSTLQIGDDGLMNLSGGGGREGVTLGGEPDRQQRHQGHKRQCDDAESEGDFY